MYLSRFYSGKNTILVKHDFFEAANKVRKGDKDTLLIDLLLCIKEENIDKIISFIKSNSIDSNTVIKILRHSLKIRPKKYELFNKFFLKYASSHQEEMETIENKKYIEEIKSIIKEMQDLMGKYTIQKAILDDNEERFIDLFNKNLSIDYNIKVSPISPLNFDEVSEIKSISFVNLIALFGSIKCFKIALELNLKMGLDVCKYAIAGGNPEIIAELKNRNVNFAESMIIAVEYHRHKICDWLIDNYKCKAFSTQECNEYFNYVALEFLVSNSIYQPPTFFKGDIITALLSKDFISLKYILENKDCSNYKTLLINFLTLIEYAAQSCFHRAVKELYYHRIYADASNCSKALLWAVRVGNLESTVFLLKEFNFNPDKMYLVSEAALYNQFEVLKYLVSIGADVNKCEMFEGSPLVHAEFHKNEEMIAFLKIHGARSYFLTD